MLDIIAAFPWDIFVATIVGGMFTLLGVWWEARNQRKISQERENARNLALVKAIYCEFEVLWIAYNRELAPFLEKLSGVGERFERIYPLYGEYFVIFENNAAQLGQLDNERVRVALVELSLAAKGMISSIIYNNQMLQERFQLRRFLYFVDNERKPMIEADLNSIENRLGEYGGQIKAGHERIKATHAEAEAAVREYLANAH